MVALGGELSGTQTGKLIHERFRIPLIYLTAYTNPATIVEAENAGEHGYLSKPVRLDNLEAAIHLAIARHRRHEQQMVELRSASETVRQQLQSDMEQFTYSAGHDLQEPLRTAGNYLDLLRRRVWSKLDADEQSLFNHAADELTRMRTLVAELVEYAQAGSASISITLCSSQSALNSAMRSLQSLIAKNDAQIDSDALPVVAADELQLALVFQNLLANAIKYRRPGERPQIRISSTRCPNGYTFSVIDNGVGFERQYAGLIFEPFKRLHGRNTHPGTGLGLAICKRIVEAHGGRIWAESSPGQGSIFRFTLPAEVDHPDERSPDSSGSSSA